MANWTVDFVTRTGRKIHIDISGKQGNTDEALVPAADPLYIEEEGDENLFVPVKTQSGYISIVTDNIGMVRSIIPVSGGTRKVYVTEILGSSYDTLWRGYIQPRMLTFKMWRGKIEVQIPIECPLSALRYKTFETSGETMTIAKLMYKLSTDFDNVLIQGTFPALSSTDASYATGSLLAKKFFTRLFNNNQYSNLDVLTYLCTFAGWTCRSGKNYNIDQSQDMSVYFLKNRNTDYVGRRDIYLLDQIQLNNAVPVGSKHYFYEGAFPSQGLADNRSELVLSEGIKSAKVSCEIDDFNFDTDLMGDDFENAIDNWQQSWVPVQTTTGKNSGYWVQTEGTAGDWKFSGYNFYAYYNTNGSMDRKNWKYYLRLAYTANTDVNHQVPGESGSMIEDYYEVTSWFEGYLDIDQLVDTEFNTQGTLTINFDSIFSINFKFYLRIVNQNGIWHYNPETQTWSHQGSDIVCTGSGRFQALIPSNMPGESTHVKGKIQIHIFELEADKDALMDSLLLQGLTLNFTARTDSVIDSRITRIEHESTSTADFSDKIDFESMLCIHEPLVVGSSNVLLNSDGSECKGLVDSPSPYTTPFNPLIQLVDEAAAEGSWVGEMLKVNIRTEYLQSLQDRMSPLTILELDDEMYYPVSITQDFRDDVTRVKLLKRRYNEQY